MVKFDSKITIKLSQNSLKFSPQKLPFPMVIVCANNMHNPINVAKKYPILNETTLKFLYGVYDEDDDFLVI